MHESAAHGMPFFYSPSSDLTGKKESQKQVHADHTNRQPSSAPVSPTLITTLITNPNHQSSSPTLVTNSNHQPESPTPTPNNVPHVPNAIFSSPPPTHTHITRTRHTSLSLSLSPPPPPPPHLLLTAWEHPNLALYLDRISAQRADASRQKEQQELGRAFGQYVLEGEV